MRKRILSILLTAALVLPMLPVITLPVMAAGASEKEIDQSTYEALGLSLYADEDAAADSVTAPFKEDGVATSIAAREVYVAMNAAHGNRYTLRDGLDTVDNTGQIHDNTRDQHSGAYAFYGGSPSSIKAENGNTVSSGLSSNSADNVLASQSNGFSGIYATSVALDGGDGKDNYVAELRAYGKDKSINYNGHNYSGTLEVAVFKIGDDGSRIQVDTLTPVIDASSCYTNSLAYMTRRYVQELDAYFEIEAGDINGDGLDDLAVYTGRYKDVDGRRYALVDVFYATGSGTWQETPSQEIAVDGGYASSYSKIDYNSDNNWKEEIVKHPVVTIAMGDIDRNLKDEVAVVSSAPANNNDADAVAHFSLLAYEEDGSLTAVGGMDKVALNDGAGSGMISAGCAFGEFAQIDNESVSATTLIIGGWSAGSSVITENKASAGYSQGAYYYVYYDYATGQYIQSGYRAKSLGGHTTSISQVFNLEGQENGGNGVRVYPTLAPMAVACGDLDGSKVQSVSDQVLFGTQVMEFNLETGFGSELFSFDFCMTQVDDNNNNKDKEQPWIGDVVVGTVDSDPSSKNWREMFLFVTGVHRKSEINTSDDYYYMDLGAVWRNENASEDDAKAGYHVLFEGVMAKSNARNDQYGTFVSLALPDVGNDSVVMRFVEKGIVYTDPEVFAVLQASPYFSDLEEVYGYIGNGGTSYGESSGSSTTGGASISGSYGFYHSATIQAVGAAEYEFSLVATASYDYSYSSDKETAISYNNQAGSGDKVVVYTIPNVLYIYEVYTPGTDGGSGTWDQVVMTTPLQAVVTMLDVDAYDEVASSTAGLEPIRGNILYSTPGQPETYVNKPAGQQEAIYDTYAQSSSAGSGSDITQEFSFSETNEHSFSVGFDFNFKVGAGGGALGNELMFGAMGNIAASGSAGWSRTEGTSFSGTVDALPEEAEGYSFSWRLLVNQATLGGSDVWVVGYEVKDVVQPPRMPQNLTVTEVGTDYVDLQWESGGNAASYILYQKTTTGNYNQVAVLPYTAESYRHEGRNPNTTYTYAIQAVSSGGAGSIYSPDVIATTMSDNASFSIVEHPDDAHAYAGGSAIFNAQGSGQGGYSSVGYEWQVNETGRARDWEKLSGAGVAGASSTSLTLNAVTEEMNGWQYRCRIYYDQYELFTAPATLIVDKADSEIALGILDGDTQVHSDTVLSAEGSVVTTDNTTVSGKKAVSVTKNGTTYTLLTGQDSNGDVCYYWFDGTNYCAYTGSAAPVLTNPDTPFDGTNTIAETPQSLTATDYTTTIDGKEVELSGPEDVSDTEPAITIPYPEGGADYTAVKQWTVTTDGYTSYTVYEAQRPVGDAIETETFYTSGGGTPAYTGCTVTYTNVITVQAAAEGTEAVTLDVSTLATAFQATSSTITTPQTHDSAGKAYTLMATPKAVAGSDAITGDDNRVYFSISNGTSGETVEAAWNESKNCYTAQWTPTMTGKLTITAVFAGNERYLSSQSDAFTIYSAVQVEDIATSSLSMSAPTNMLYGQAGTIAVTKLTVDDGAATSADVTDSAAYTVEKRGEDGVYAEANSADYALGGGTFTPLAVGTFRITATNNNLTASTVISVGKATLTIAAQNTEKAVNDENRDPEDAAITTNNGRTVQMTRDADYTVTSDGTTAALPGTYSIQVALKNSQTVQTLQANYNIITQGATYTLTSEAYQVTATAGANGSVSISYQADDHSALVPIQSGASLPQGSKVTVTATPETGYVVGHWMVNGSYVTESSSASYYTGTAYTIDSLKEASNVSVEFALGSSTLTYEAKNEGDDDSAHGQVKAYYVNGGVQGSQCASGNAVNYNQTVRVAAQPDEGYTIHHWTVQKGDGGPQILLAPDGISYFTGTSNDFSQFSEDMIVTVYFTEEETIPVTIQPVGNDGGPLVNATVSVNGEQLSWDEGENAFVYQGKTGENLTITVIPPSGLLVQGWAVGEHQTTGSLSNQNQTMTLYNLQSNTDFTVTCAALNTYTVTFGGKLGEKPITDGIGAVTAAKIGATGTGLTSGEVQAQGSAILFAAQAQNGYEIAGWTVNGETVAANGTLNSQTYQIPNLSGSVSVEVTFRAKPTVTIESSANGTVTVTGTVNGVEVTELPSGSYVDFGSDFTVTLKPDVGYEVGAMIGLDPAYTDTTGQTTDDKACTISNVQTDQTITPVWSLLPTSEISYSVVDQTGDNLGDYGTLTIQVERKGMEDYKAEQESDGSETVYRDSTVTFAAVPEQGYKVGAWFVNGVAQSDAPQLTIVENMEDQDIQVRFDPIGEAITYGFRPDGVDGKAQISAVFRADGSNTDVDFAAGSTPATDGQLTVSVSDLAEGYELEGWYLNGSKQTDVTGTTFTYSVQVGVGAEIQAKIIRSSYAVTFYGDNGTVTAMADDGQIRSGDLVVGDAQVTFTARPESDSGYTFAGWIVNGESRSEETEALTLTITEATEVQAVYTLNAVKYTVSYGVLDGNGTVTVDPVLSDSPAQVNAGTGLTFTAQPETGFQVAGWYSDAAGSTVIPGTAAEQNSYTIGNLTDDAAVYVKFEPVPTYTISVAVSGRGSVTATVNGVEASVVQGTLTVSRHDDVVLIAHPEADQYLSGWTLDGAEQVNNLTLTLEDVTGAHQVTACFEASQLVNFTTVCGTGGTLSAQAGYGDELDDIVADKGTQLEKGKKVVLTVVPDDGMMISRWMVNDEVQDTLSNTLNIESLTENTTVEVTFEPLTLFDLPADGPDYTISDIGRVPDDYGSDRQIRKGGYVTFQVVPAQGQTITALTVNNGGSATQKTDGSWTVTVENVQEDIILNATVASGIPLVITEPANGTITVKRGGDTLSSGAAVQANDQLVISAVANTGYTLKSLTVNGTSISSGSTYTVTGEERTVTVEAIFQAQSTVIPGGGGGGGGGGVETGYDILVTPGDNGSLKTDPAKAGEGSSVTVTAEPEAGYELIRVTVTDGDGQMVDVTVREDGSCIFVMPASEVTVEGFFALINPADCQRNEDCPLYVYKDVDVNAWYHDALHYCVDRGLMNGMGGGVFAPGGTTSRAMIVTMLYRLEGEPQITGDNGFADVSADSWYSRAVAWAAANGIVKGYGDNTFGPEDAVTREQVVSILYRYAAYQGYDLDSQGTLNEFHDGDQVSGWAAEAMLWALTKGVVNGKGNGALDPTGDATRAEIAQIFMNSVQKFHGA